MSKTIESTIAYYQYLDHQSQLTPPLEKLAIDISDLVTLYHLMYFTRSFDQKAVALQRTGRLGTYASSLGQEAIGTAIGMSMQTDDVLLPSYREYAAQLIRGVSITDLLLYWGGDERGNQYSNSPLVSLYQYSKPLPAKRDFPICVPIASQTCHAAGVAYAMKLKAQAQVSVCVIGDGGSSKGDFYEAMNASGVWQLPIVFIISNNRWAISLPREKQSACATLAQKGVAAGIPGEQVDGNDIIACCERFKQAIEKARSGNGPTIIEALTYRLGDHTTADDASRYRSEELLNKYKQYDPLKRLKNYLLMQQLKTKTELQAIEEEADSRVEDEIKRYLHISAMPAEQIFNHLYEQLPETLLTQQKEVQYYSQKLLTKEAS